MCSSRIKISEDTDLYGRLEVGKGSLPPLFWYRLEAKGAGASHPTPRMP